jgi:hypothetical protein
MDEPAMRPVAATGMGTGAAAAAADSLLPLGSDLGLTSTGLTGGKEGASDELTPIEQLKQFWINERGQSLTLSHSIRSSQAASNRSAGSSSLFIMCLLTPRPLSLSQLLPSYCITKRNRFLSFEVSSIDESASPSSSRGTDRFAAATPFSLPGASRSCIRLRV